ncbi:MAG TPA: peptidoglycan-binding domain-containing protein [Gaiellaceae bacterium]|nr:peptidoglycan-binding domain-containing protein [Gaiellaceae bacterium]
MADEPDAVTLEDDDQLSYVGEDADPPTDTGRGPSDEDLEPPEEEAPPEELPEAGAATTWRVSKALLALRAEIDARWPNRDRRTDGTIGDANHCGPGRTSDHCPNPAGVVRALDVDSDGIPAGWLAEHVRKRGAAGDARLANGGYVIFNRRIASWSHGWAWRTYTGQDPHTSHIHVSISRDASGYDGAGRWEVRGATPTPTPTSTTSLPSHALGSRILQLADPHMRGTDVAFVQRWVGTPDNGDFGPETKSRVERYQRIVGLEPTGVVGPLTWRAMRVA